MPKRKVQTDQGNFEVELDQEPENDEQLRQIVSDYLAQNPEVLQTEKRSDVAGNVLVDELSKRKGFLQTTAQEIVAGVKQMLSAFNVPEGGRTGTDELIGAFNLVAGGARIGGAPFEGLRQKAGEVAQDVALIPGIAKPTRAEDVILKRLGITTEDVSAGIATAANLGTMFAGPTAIQRTGSALFRRAPFRLLGPEQQRVVQLGERFAVEPSAGQIRGTPGLAQLESFPERFPIGAKRIVEFGEKQRGQTLAATKKIGEKISPEQLTPTEAGQLAKDTLIKESKSKRAQSTALYEGRSAPIPAEASSSAINTSDAVAVLNEELRLTRGIVAGKPSQIAKKLTPEELMVGDTPISEIRKVNPDLADQLVEKFGLDAEGRTYTFKGLDLILQEVRSNIRQAVRSQNDNLARRLKILEDGLEKDRLELAARFGADDLVRDADAFFATEVAPFFTKKKLPRVLSDKEASQVVKSAVWLNRDKPENIRLLERAINNPQGFNKVVRAWWDDLITKSTDPKTKLFSPNRLLTQYEKFSPEVKEVLLKTNAKAADELMELFSVLSRSRIMSQNPSETARGLLSAGQTMGIVKIGQTGISIGGSLLTGQMKAAAEGLGKITREGIIILSPALIAKVLTSPKGIQWLTVGMKSAPGSASGQVAALRILAIANALPKDQEAREEVIKVIKNTLKDPIATMEEKMDSLNPLSGQQ